MHGVYALKEMLCKELEEYGEKGELSTGTLDTVDKLAHTVKNLNKIIEEYEEMEYSGNYYGDWPSDRGSTYDRDRSFARGRVGNVRRDSRGRYSRTGDFTDHLRKLMNDAPDDHTRNEIQKLVSKLEMM